MSSSSQALRSNLGKPQLSQIRFFGTALSKLAKVMEKGREKYPDSTPGVPNWTLGGKPDEEYLDAADRHITKFVNGEHYDDEMGTHHLAHAAWNLLALLENNYPEMPDLTEDLPSVFSPSAVWVDGGGDMWFRYATNLWWARFRDGVWANADSPMSRQKISNIEARYGGSLMVTPQETPRDAPWL